MSWTQKHMASRGLRSYWSAPGPARGQSSGALVTALRPIVAKPFFVDSFDTEMAHLWNTRIAGAWIETKFVNHGFAVLSFYGISGSNASSSKKLESKRLLLALLCHIGAHRLKPIFLCMDANLCYEKSEVMQSLAKLGWVDLAAGLGGTYKIDPGSSTRQVALILCSQTRLLLAW